MMAGCHSTIMPLITNGRFGGWDNQIFGISIQLISHHSCFACGTCLLFHAFRGAKYSALTERDEKVRFGVPRNLTTSMTTRDGCDVSFLVLSEFPITD